MVRPFFAMEAVHLAVTTLCFNQGPLMSHLLLPNNSLVTHVTKKLECLVLGETPGEKKVMKAEELGIKTMHAHEYLQLYGDQ